MAAAPTKLSHHDLEIIAIVSLRAARMIMESGGRAEVISQSAKKMAHGFDVHFLGLRVGYASLTLTLSSGDNTITRMIVVGRHGVNHRLDQEVRRLVSRVAAKEFHSVAEVGAELDRISAETPHHKAVCVALAVGLACASFGRLLGIDWLAFGPVFLAATLSQLMRRQMLKHNANLFVVATLIAFSSSFLAGLGTRLAGSSTVDLAMMASILLLVPGVPATNAQTDIMDGHPTTGSARAVSVIMIMIFATTGLWLAGAILGTFA